MVKHGETVSSKVKNKQTSYLLLEQRLSKFESGDFLLAQAVFTMIGVKNTFLDVVDNVPGTLSRSKSDSELLSSTRSDSNQSTSSPDEPSMPWPAELPQRDEEYVKFADGRITPGSAKHGSGKCKPCLWLHSSAGCNTNAITSYTS